MQVKELMQRIDAMYPSAFTNETSRRSWGSTFYEILNPFEGETLARAWDATMREYIKVAFPKPGEILTYCHREKPAATNDGGFCRNWKWIERRKSEHIENWNNGNPKLRNDAEREGWQYQLNNELWKKANRVAQQEYIRFKGGTPLRNENMMFSEHQIASIRGDFVNKGSQGGNLGRSAGQAMNAAKRKNVNPQPTIKRDQPNEKGNQND